MRFYGKEFRLSDLCLFATGFLGATFVGKKAIAGGTFILDRHMANTLKAGEEVLVSMQNCSEPETGIS